MSRIFIVLATYNGERFLSTFLDSLLSIMVFDDGSKDSTISIPKGYERKLPLQILCEEKNQGHRVAFAKDLYDHSITKRQTSFFQVTALFWLWKHKNILFPHCHQMKDFLSRVLFSIVGVPLAKSFFGKK